MNGKTEKAKKDWRRELTPEQYRVTREKGTESPFSGEFNDHKGRGTYTCVCCGADLFESDTKYASGTGWPSFWSPAKHENIEEHEDVSLGMARVEVTCSKCGAHLGHVFPDGPRPTGLRYCINSVSLDFKESDSGDKHEDSTE